jgi:large subunit ribosomal protein L29
MKAADYREQTIEDLRLKEAELAEQLFALRLQKVTGQLEKPSKITEVKRDLARVLTVIGELERTATAEASAGESTT